MQNRTHELLPLIEWQLVSFDGLNTHTLFELLKLRIDIFVVEQQCAYPELDELDRAPDTLHLMGFVDTRYVDIQPADSPQNRTTQNEHANNVRNDAAQRQIIACARLMTPSQGIAKIGRVAVHQGVRREGVAREGMLKLLQHVALMEPCVNCVELSAQVFAMRFYESLGFTVVSEEYIEDGIPHVDMRREGKGR